MSSSLQDEFVEKIN